MTDKTATIERLLPENYGKCANIWDMEKDPVKAKRWYEDMVSGNRMIFVYNLNGQYVAEGSLVIKNDDPDYTIPGKRVYFSRLVVSKSYRNRGIGGEMVDFLINSAIDLGYTEATIGVDIGNVGARWLYEKKGFTNTIFVGEDKDGKFVKLLKKL